MIFGLELEMFYLNSTLNFGMPPVLVFQLEVYYKVDRLLTGLTAQLKGTTARWYSNKTSLHHKLHSFFVLNTQGQFEDIVRNKSTSFYFYILPQLHSFQIFLSVL